MVISRQGVNGIMQAAKKASVRRKIVLEEEGGKVATKGHTYPLGTQTSNRSRKKKNIGMSFIKSCLNVAKSSTCF